ncbi:MAG: phytoene desaturase [Hymenobacteraceae bacterium]|nr:phytoene desaturase [Hymenobacteraceae bacterium]
MPQAIVIGAGFAGLSCATALARRGYAVTVVEKNEQPGGRARQWEQAGFTFDMGPSWYWMPEVFADYFARYGHQVSDFYELQRLDPSYQVVFGPGDTVAVPAAMPALRALFERLEPGAAGRLDEFLRQAAYKYRVGMTEFVWKPSRSFREFLDPRLVVDAVRLDLLQSMSRHVRKFFRHPHLLKLLEFPVLFLGATPQNTPALYSLMNYADLALGTWYPHGGMHQIVRALVSVAQENGVRLRCGAPVAAIEVAATGHATGVRLASGEILAADVVVAAADYHHAEQQLLPARWRTYDAAYWQSRTMAPSSLLFYLGVNRRCANLTHHTLFFDEDFNQHAADIYETPAWPARPLFYVSATSVTDSTVAPAGCENLFLLMPVAPGLTDDDDATRERYYNLLMARLEAHCGHPIREHVVVKRAYAHRDFAADYHAFRGNAYGLANTLRQTALLKPALKSAKVRNLYFTGQLTVPGPGVPPALISGEVVAREIARDFPPPPRPLPYPAALANA